ncbi:nuclear transport factor 2 family protein [Sphingorhabdus sp.]|jgi:steroid delta-isomerase|uniref:nuclear transport factor 2 family protein n=1 Tax=Sphingorhabdus sp. TaxID=1902408 RepID=UPI0037C58666
MPTTEQKLAAVHGYVDAFARGDTEAIVALFDANATVEDPIGTPIKRGHDEIRAFYQGSTATGAKLELLGEPRCAADYVAFPFAVRLEWQGQKSVIEVIDTFRLNDEGKIVEMRAYWGPENMKAG